MIAGLARVEDGALKALGCCWITQPELKRAGLQPSFGQACRITGGFEHGGGCPAFLQRLGDGSVSQVVHFREQDADPGPQDGRTRRRGNLGALGQHGIRLVQVTGLIQQSAQDPQQLRPQPLVGNRAGERTFQPAAALLKEPPGEPETAQRQREPRPGLIVSRQRPLQRAAEVVEITRQHPRLMFGLGQAKERQRVPLPGSLDAADRGQPGHRVLAHRLQQPVARPVPAGATDTSDLPASRSITSSAAA